MEMGPDSVIGRVFLLTIKGQNFRGNQPNGVENSQAAIVADVSDRLEHDCLIGSAVGLKPATDRNSHLVLGPLRLAKSSRNMRHGNNCEQGAQR